MSGRLVFATILCIPLVAAFDWGDFHKVAVIFFSFFGPAVILGAIAAIAYFACVRSWYESFREEVRETHRSYHPWPPGSAKWQLQQYVRGNGPPPVKHLKATPPPMIQKSTPSPIPPGQLFSPASHPNGSIAQGPIISPSPHHNTKESQMSLQSPPPSVQNKMNNYREKLVSPQPLEIYCGPSSTYVPYTVSSPHERSEAGQQLEAITVRTTTTTRRTTVLSPIPKRPYTVV
ncbi:unnamed protein product [Haemonchus placei]|uniref:Uncharacterized protein n=1 Tax=Haemonchus placei TaxID=6290 RepID=A0A0N4W6N7_HAEPC|nr:unnamed protein product [Haemonchus placei]